MFKQFLIFNKNLKSFLKKTIEKSGFEIHKKKTEFPNDFTENDFKIIKMSKPYTMTSTERIFALIQAVKYVEKNKIPGSIVECGVWKGGSMMAVVQTLLDLDNTNFDLYLFDTFEGMSKPSEFDISSGVSAIKEFSNKKIDDNSSDWCNSSLNNVQNVLFKMGYDNSKFHFIKGKVEDTLPEKSPKNISILRLDTDWYESTKHELVHLFPCLSKGGVIIIDDYGYWDGARKAVDEYFSQNNISILLNRIDYTGRIGIKI